MAQPLIEKAARPAIKVFDQGTCPLCGDPGRPAYSGLHDFMYDAPGEWSFWLCGQPSCGVIWLNPVPTREDIGKAYETYYTHEAGGGRPAAPGSGRNGPIARLLRRTRDAHLARRLGYGPPDAGGRSGKFVARALTAFPGGRDLVDDLACFTPAPTAGNTFLELGFGHTTQMRRMRRLGWQVIGVDKDPSAAESARAQGFSVLLGDLEEHRIAAGSIDAVYGSHVLEHVYEPLRTLQECRRILRPGGTLVMLTPNADSWGRQRYGKHWLGLDAPRHLIVFTPTVLAELARQAGFAEVRVTTTSRAAGLFLACSSSIRRNGKLPHERPLRAGDWLVGALSQVVESSLLATGRSCGEELVLVAR